MMTWTSKSKMMLVSMMHARTTPKECLEHLGSIHMMGIVEMIVILVAIFDILTGIVTGLFPWIWKHCVSFTNFFEFGFVVGFFFFWTSNMTIWNRLHFNEIFNRHCIVWHLDIFIPDVQDIPSIFAYCYQMAPLNSFESRVNVLYKLVWIKIQQLFTTMNQFSFFKKFHYFQISLPILMNEFG